MKRCISTLWLRGACILSAILIGMSMGGAWQTASAADKPDDESSGQTVDQTGLIEGQSDEVVSLALPIAGKSVTHTRSTNYVFPFGTNNLVPLTAAPEVVKFESDTFTTSGKVVVTYTAECAVGAPPGNTITWLNIDMRLRNVVTGTFIDLPPSSPNNSDAFCTADGFGPFNGWVMASITGIANGLPLSDYKVQVRANLQSGVAGSSGWLGDTSLVIRK